MHRVVAYLLINDNKTRTVFLLSKSRFSSITEKVLTIPNLKLEAVFIEVRLKDSNLENLAIKISNVNFWVYLQIV